VRSDAELVRVARADSEAFAELYRRHVRPVHGWLRVRVPARIAVELTAETFAQAALGLRRFRPPADGSALPWLVGIARNLYRTYVEREMVEAQARARLGVEIRADDDFVRAEERAFAAQVRGELGAGLAALPPAQLEALQLRVVEELPYAQVAQRLGCSEVAARIRVTRALGTLARLVPGE
jgi:RNA polymerase sigma factor (sigma-70 family)